MSLIVGSLFSGIGGFDLGLERAGMTVRWQAEIDKDARKVLARWWPAAHCYDDVKEIDGRAPRVDVLCGGFPCQDLSVAGRRAGLAGERSGLFHEFMRVVDEVAPRWVVIENVPGLLSSNDGRDMGTVLGTLADLGYGWAYRVLDAQFFGVAQRRRRVFIVGCAGDPSGAASVLFEPESCDGDPAPSRATGTRVAASVAGSTLQGGGGRGYRVDAEGVVGGQLLIADTLRSHPRPGSNSNGAMAVVSSGQGWWDQSDIATTLAARDRGCSGPATLAFHQKQDPITEDDLTPALGATSAGMGVAYPLAVRGRGDESQLEVGKEGTYNALRAGDGSSSRQNLVAFDTTQVTSSIGCSNPKPGDPCHPLTAGGHPPTIVSTLAVRRLTPMECERLQGFPDGWTDELKDSARYRTLGNAVAVPVAEWIGRRIAPGGSR